MIKGSVWKFGDNIDTDQIIASQHLLDSDINEMKRHTFAAINRSFVSEFIAGDIIVAGKNFGCGSSREQAPMVLKEMGVSCIIAKSFARIFFRNAINIGLLVLIVKKLHENVNRGDYIKIYTEEGIIKHNGKIYSFAAYPQYITDIINHGGMINLINNTGGLK